MGSSGIFVVTVEHDANLNTSQESDVKHLEKTGTKTSGRETDEDSAIRSAEVTSESNCS
jgi:hypothetical protein